jgi:hypothetical protein
MFTTSRVSTAAYLITGRHLRLVDVEVDAEGYGLFVFDDPYSVGPRLEAKLLHAESGWPSYLSVGD